MQQLFHIEFELPNPMPMDFIRLIPEQRNVLNLLLADGSVKSYSLAADRSKLWMIAAASDEEEVWDMLTELPMIDYLDPVITELAFHKSSEQVLQFSLN